MATRHLDFSVEKRDPKTCIYKLAGSLLGDPDGFRFQNEVRSQVAGGTKKLILDLAEIGRMDSCGIGILAAITCSAQKNGAGIVLSSLSPRVEKLLGVVGFYQWVSHADSVAEALEILDGMDFPPIDETHH